MKWLLDSGCACHATGDKEIFTQLRPYRGTKVVKTPDGVQHAIAGYGDVTINLRYGGSLLLKNVYHVPALQMNLISVARITDDDGMYVFFGPRDARVIRRDSSNLMMKTAAQAKRVGNSYVLISEPADPAIKPSGGKRTRPLLSLRFLSRPRVPFRPQQPH